VFADNATEGILIFNNESGAITAIGNAQNATERSTCHGRAAIDPVQI
jgi:hypothetical protein